LLTTAGADRALIVDLHAPQLQGYFNIPSTIVRLAGVGRPFQEVAAAEFEWFHLCWRRFEYFALRSTQVS
jgi:hypothetical protein